MKTPSMRRYILWFLLALTVLVTLAYGFLMNTYLIKGLKAEASFDMQVKAYYFAQEYKENPNASLPKDCIISSYLGVKNLPEIVKKTFPKTEYEHLKLYLNREANENIEEDKRSFLMLLPYELHDGKKLFLLKTYRRELENFIDGPDIELMLLLNIPVGFLVVLLFFFGVRYMLHKLYKPVNALTHWAGELTPETLEKPVPNFGYQEINQLSQLLHGNMLKLHKTLKREERFLRNASHELRTPLAIIKSNIELLNRLEPNLNKPVKSSLERIQRASYNMNRLIETLLWLGMKEKQASQPKEPIALDALVQDLVSENSYLLQGKKVEIALFLKPIQVRVDAHAARIAMGNLIRNAFQYTALGKIEIQVARGLVTVRNLNKTEQDMDSKGSDYGFGLGLVLVEQITEKSGWKYENKAILGGREATIVFSCENNEENCEKLIK